MTELIIEAPKIAIGTPITIYKSGEFMGNISKYEGKYQSHGTEKYAQYSNCPFVTFIPTRKRTLHGFRGNGYKPYLLILEGIGHPAPPEADIVIESKPGLVVRQSKYSSFDQRWVEDFEAMIDQYLPTVKVIADYRHTKGFNSQS